MEMRVLAFGASNHSVSINAAFARFAAERFKAEHVQDAVLEELDLNDFEMPIYSIDRERDGGIPTQARSFFDRIGSCDRLIISYPEYNGSYPSAWKNIHDWVSRIDAKIYQDKPSIALSATPGPRAGAGILGAVEESAPFFGMDLRGVVGVGKWGEAFDASSQRLTNPTDDTALNLALSDLI
ncbi:MAG: NAD(P)H-dependent oxidoreductase [Pseudomonadota bacterium]